MRATGSDDVEARDVFVPEDYALDRSLIGQGTAPGQLWNEGPLYRVPYGSLACLVAAATGIGVGEWAVDDFRERLGSRTMAFSKATQGESQVEQVRLANLAAEMRAGALVFDEAVGLVARACRGEQEMTIEERATVRMWVAHAVAVARHTVLQVAAASGSKAHFLHDPLQRAVRDIGTLSSHHVFNVERNGETYGRVALGLEYDAASI
jgi:alkylation response protein AidB-like acyl-CoA dehydrogenase